MYQLSLIAACSQNRVIGCGNQLPWQLPDDLKHFKKLTLNKTIVMGRKTFESIGRPLPKRHNIVMTRQSHLAIAGCEVISDRNKILSLAQQQEVMVIGGEMIYQLFLPYANTIYLTTVNCQLDGDAFFPEFDLQQWQETMSDYHPQDDAHAYSFNLTTLKRVN